MNDAVYARLCQETWGVDNPEVFGFSHADVNGQLTICFRGTKTPYEWLIDFLAWPLFPLQTTRDIRLGPVHAGFLAAAENLLPHVFALILARGGPFALCGHSAGGALASVVGGLLAVNKHLPAEVVTFGAPRAGTEVLGAILSRVPFRQYVYGGDPVPDVPTNPPFRHAREPLLQLGPRLNWTLKDHSITHYINSLEQSHERAPNDAAPRSASEPLAFGQTG